MPLKGMRLRDLGLALLSSASLVRLALGNRSEWSPPALPLRDIPTLGPVSMDGDIESVGFASSGVPYGVGNTPSVMGALVNKRGQPAGRYPSKVPRFEVVPPGNTALALVATFAQ